MAERNFQIRQLDEGRVRHDEPRHVCVCLGCHSPAGCTVRLVMKGGSKSRLIHYCLQHYQDIGPNHIRYWWHPFEGEYRPAEGMK